MGPFSILRQPLNKSGMCVSQYGGIESSWGCQCSAMKTLQRIGKWNEGGNTRIFSKTPEVQATIEKIRQKEVNQLDSIQNKELTRGMKSG